ncbi:MAG: hypothetical protein ACP5LH_02950 [Candidatus Micrarchaeia archaeon]
MYKKNKEQGRIEIAYDTLKKIIEENINNKNSTGLKYFIPYKVAKEEIIKNLKDKGQNHSRYILYKIINNLYNQDEGIRKITFSNFSKRYHKIRINDFLDVKWGEYFILEEYKEEVCKEIANRIRNDKIYTVQLSHYLRKYGFSNEEVEKIKEYLNIKHEPKINSKIKYNKDNEYNKEENVKLIRNNNNE